MIDQRSGFGLMMNLNRCLREKRWDELRKALGTGCGSVSEPATGAITAYTAENTVSTLS